MHTFLLATVKVSDSVLISVATGPHPLCSSSLFFLPKIRVFWGWELILSFSLSTVCFLVRIKWTNQQLPTVITLPLTRGNTQVQVSLNKATKYSFQILLINSQPHIFAVNLRVEVMQIKLRNREEITSFY